MTSFFVQGSAPLVAGSAAQLQRYIPAQVRGGGNGRGVAKAMKMSPPSENGSIVVVDPKTGLETLNLSSSREILIAELQSAAKGRDPNRYSAHLEEFLETEEGNDLLTRTGVSCRESPNRDNILACVSQLDPIDEALVAAFEILPQITGSTLSMLAHRNNQFTKAAFLFLVHDRNARKVKQCVFFVLPLHLLPSCTFILPAPCVPEI